MPETHGGRPGSSFDDLRWWQRPLPVGVWLVGLLAIAGWVALQLVAGHLAKPDLDQQYQLVQALAKGQVRGALRGISPQASPPGYAFFALPFHLVFQHYMPTHQFYKPNDGYYVAGYAALIVLGISSLMVMRSVGVAAQAAELLGVTAVVGGGATLACYTEAFHPGDALATACMLLASVAALRDRWAWAAAALGFGLLCKQWMVVPIAVLATLYPGRPRAWVVAGPAVIFTVVIAPFFATDAHGTMSAISANGVQPTDRSWIAHLGQQLKWVWSLEARVLPLVLVAMVCLWLYRARPTVTPELLFTALAVTMLIRPPLDPAGYVYYSAPGLVLLATMSRDWRWPISSLVIGVLLDALARRAYFNRELWPAIVVFVMLVGLVIVATTRLWHLVSSQTTANRPEPEVALAG